METEKYGILLNKDIKLHRQWFNEMVRLIGIYVIYRAPKPDKRYTTYAEIESNYEKPELVGCIFNEHLPQQTLKKMGWMSELDESASVIDVPYDLPGLQQGALFIVPSGLDTGKGRLFRVTKLTNSIIYPASITCQIVPEYEDTIDDTTAYNYTGETFTMLNEEKDPIFG